MLTHSFPSIFKPLVSMGGRGLRFIKSLLAAALLLLVFSVSFVAVTILLGLVLTNDKDTTYNHQSIDAKEVSNADT